MTAEDEKAAKAEQADLPDRPDMRADVQNPNEEPVRGRVCVTEIVFVYVTDNVFVCGRMFVSFKLLSVSK